MSIEAVSDIYLNDIDEELKKWSSEVFAKTNADLIDRIEMQFKCKAEPKLPDDDLRNCQVAFSISWVGTKTGLAKSMDSLNHIDDEDDVDDDEELLFNELVQKITGTDLVNLTTQFSLKAFDAKDHVLFQRVWNIM